MERSPAILGKSDEAIAPEHVKPAIMRRMSQVMEPTAGRHGVRAALAAALLFSAVLLGVAHVNPSAASADARTDYLVRLLSTSSTFRVRAQAALSLGRIEGDPAVVRALSQALGDAHPSVRTAAASSLQRLADPAALGALRAHARDSDSGTRRAIAGAVSALERVARSRPTHTPASTGAATGNSGPAQYYVGVGTPGSRVPSLDAATLAAAREFVSREVSSINGVALAPDGESSAAATRAIRRRHLAGYFVDSAITQVEQSDRGLRVTVSVIVGTYPGRDMRAMLSGAATVQGGAGASARRLAIEAALRSALRRLPQALAASGGRASR